MKKAFFKRAGVFALSAALALTMCTAGVFAAGTGGAYNSDNTDYLKNNTRNSTAIRQQNAAFTTWMNNSGNRELIGAGSGVVTLGKILNVNQRNKFPNVTDFVYKVTPVSAWDNANADTAKSGAAIAKKDMPTPTSGAGGADHKAVVKEANSNDWYALITIGNFKDSAQANASGNAGSDAASNEADNEYRRTRTTDLKFTFTKAGYYMYKVEEVGSIRNGTDISSAAVNLRKDVSGVDYDNNTYYMVFYVTNTQATRDSVNPPPNAYGQGTRTGDTIGAEQGDTIVNEGTAPAGGVYVHTITSWTNSRSTDHQAADLQDGDALSNAKDLMNTADNGGNAAKPNTGRVDGNNDGAADNGNPGSSTVTHDNLGKVGSSGPGEDPPQPARAPDTGSNYITSGPNTLEAYRMWNAQVSHDVVLKKNVTGNLGDRTKQFEFTVALTGLENEQVYTTNEVAGSSDITSTISAANPANVTNTGDQTTPSVVLYDAAAGTLSPDGRSFTSSAEGTATFKVKLRDDEILVLNALPRSASYQITEAASDHVPQYDIVSTNEARSGDVPVIVKSADKTVGASNTALSTGLEFVDRYDGTMTIVYQNNRDLATVTGVPGLDYMVYATAILVLAAAAYAIIRRRRRYEEEFPE
ncbi:MAG: hypothetical protein IJ109_02660 [Firmicutes bacterium]|nr:hypothetical protein [Bacillota bacterium]